jgi:hypothetical protein
MLWGAISMSDETNEIAIRLGSAFSVLANEFLPAATEALGRSTKEITFGCTVHLKQEQGVITGRIKAHEPKIPTPAVEPIHFVLNRDGGSGLLSFLFSGSLGEMKKELANRDVGPGDE